MEVEFHHKAKPWHGWREFLREYVIVVVGVLTAATVGLTLGSLHDRNEIHEARQALHAELVKDATILRDNLLEDRCLLAAVNHWATVADRPPKPQAPVIGLFGYPTAAVWDTVRSGAVTRMPLKEKLAYANFYDDVGGLQGLAAQKMDLLMRLGGYQANWPPSPAEIRLARQDLLRAQILLTGKVWNEGRLLAEVKSLGARPPPLSSAARAVLEAECRGAGVPLGAID